MRIHKIAAIPADGIGPEVIAAGLEVLNALASDDGGFKFDIEHFPWSSDYYLEHGYYIPEGGLEKLKTFDAIFFGAVGSQQVPDHVSLWGLRLSRFHRPPQGKPTMARTVQCIKLGQEAEGLDFPPYPGELGKRIWE
eukprot:gene29742-36837_t